MRPHCLRARRLCHADSSLPQATKILFQNGSSVPHVATGVEFGKADGSGSRQVAYARKEVIVAAGAINVRLLSNAPSVLDNGIEADCVRRPPLSCSSPALGTRPFSAL